MRIDGEGGQPQAPSFGDVAVGRKPVRLHRQSRCTATAQRLAQQRETLGEARADDKPVGRDADPAGACEIGAQCLPQLWTPTRIAVAQRRVRRVVQRAAHRPQPGRAGEGGQIRGTGAKVVAGPRFAGRLRPSGLGRGRSIGDARTRPLPRDEPALGDELAVGVGDGVASDAEVLGQRPRRGKPCPGMKAPASDRIAQSALESGSQPPAGQVEVQVYAGSGPGSWHSNGPYRWADLRIGSKGMTTTDTTPIAIRLDFDTHAAGFSRALARLDSAATKELDQVDFDPRLRELVRVRASQLNGCAYCIDMHTKDARAVGETEGRLYALPAWRETPYFTDRERAALAFTESVTLMADGHVSDEAFGAWPSSSPRMSSPRSSP
jgi:AhpD family alkylhydroperoxidase